MATVVDAAATVPTAGDQAEEEWTQVSKGKGKKSASVHRC